MYTQQGGGLCIHARRTMYTRTADYVYTARWTMYTQSWGLHMYIPNSGELCIYSTALDYVYTAPRRTMYTRHADNVYTALETMYTPIGVDYVYTWWTICIYTVRWTTEVDYVCLYRTAADYVYVHGTVDNVYTARTGDYVCIYRTARRWTMYIPHWTTYCGAAYGSFVAKYVLLKFIIFKITNFVFLLCKSAFFGR